MHESAHNMGAVQPTAPDHDEGNPWHCGIRADVMCYRESRYPSVCTDEEFDCRGDNYFDAQTEDGTYLRSHWNIAWPGNNYILRELVGG